MSSRAIPTVYIKYEYEGRMYKEGCAKLNRSPFGCSRSSTGSIPGILPNIVHTVLQCKKPGTENGPSFNLGTKRVFFK